VFVRAAVACIASLVAAGCAGVVSDAVRGRVEQNLTFDLPASLPDGLHVSVCGAGGPMPDVERSSSCLAVIAGTTVFLVDVGGSSARNLARAGLPPDRVERVLLTHFHSDHIDGLGEVATLRWAAGDWTEPLAVHGPSGVEQVVEGFNLAYAQDQTYRTRHHGEAVAPPAAAGMTAVAFPVPTKGQAVVVFERGPLRVLAFSVDHAPVDPAVGYRIEYRDRSIAISGDTARYANLSAHARGVDVLFHEALSRELVGLINEAATDVGDTTLAKITADILDYHASPVEAAESAAEAGAGALVLYHVVPPLPARPLERIYAQGVDDAFDGPVEVAVDGTFVSLPAGTDAILLESP